MVLVVIIIVLLVIVGLFATGVIKFDDKEDEVDISKDKINDYLLEKYKF